MKFLGEVQGWSRWISRLVPEPASASRHVNVDGDSDDELEELDKLVRKVNVENEEPNKPAAPDHGIAKDFDEEEQEEQEEDPYSSMFESQAWPYDPNKASGIYERHLPK